MERNRFGEISASSGFEARVDRNTEKSKCQNQALINSTSTKEFETPGWILTGVNSRVT